MSARGALAIEKIPNTTASRVDVLQSNGFLVLRSCNLDGPEPLVNGHNDAARVALAAGTAGPLGGDDFSLDVHVGTGSTLVLTEISAMLVLPGPHGDRSRMQVSVRVDEGATFVWMPKPIIAARGCNHDHNVRVHLAADARMIMREETMLGRHREAPGNFRSTLRVCYNERPIYHQQLRFGPENNGSKSAAVLGDSRAVGSVIAVDPSWATDTPAASAYHSDAVLAPLPGPGVLISAVAKDNLRLRQLLDAGLNQLGPPWQPGVLHSGPVGSIETQCASVA